MTPQSIDQTQINGYTQPSPVRLRQEIRDRSGRPYELLDRIDFDHCYFTLHSAAGKQVAQLVLDLDVTTVGSC